MIGVILILIAGVIMAIAFMGGLGGLYQVAAIGFAVLMLVFAIVSWASMEKKHKGWRDHAKVAEREYQRTRRPSSRYIPGSPVRESAERDEKEMEGAVTKELEDALNPFKKAIKEGNAEEMTRARIHAREVVAHVRETFSRYDIYEWIIYDLVEPAEKQLKALEEREEAIKKRQETISPPPTRRVARPSSMQNEAEQHHERGLALLKEGGREQAILEFSKAIELNPNVAILYHNRASAYGHKGQYNLAIADYNKAIELDPSMAVAYYNRGLTYRNTGQYDLAIADCTRVIELNPSMAEAYHSRGLAYDDAGQHHLAIADYNKAIELVPNLADAYNNRGVAYLGLGQFERAIEDYDMAIRLDPKYADAYANRALSYTLLGMDAAAWQDVSRAVELGFDPDLLKADIERLKEQR